ncbi:MAG: endonuclease [Deltaproteobacteria bacterium]|nr:endonuclease [Deltaproteobacteria bacterium]
MSDLHELETFLRQSLDDDRLSRAERSVLKQLVEEQALEEQARLWLQHRAFELAKERLFDGRDAALVDWLEEVAKALRPAPAAGNPDARVAEAYFLPDPRGLSRLLGVLQNCRRTLEVCLFTITHDELAAGLLDAHGRGVQVRVVTDDLKAHDLGSDVGRLSRAGIQVRTDDSPAHMHNKFAVLDSALVVTGSFNWTRTAAEENQESFIISDEPALVEAHRLEFERLWAAFA